MPDPRTTDVTPAPRRVRQRTWAGNRVYRCARWHEPTTQTELAALVAGSRRLRVLGSRHSFNDLGDAPDGDLVALRGLPGEVEVDAARRVARVTPWSTYAEVAERLHVAGWALPALPSLRHISVGGAIATASHGSGVGNRTLADPVLALEYLDPAGESRRVDRDDPHFGGHVAALGALGVWTRVHLALEPTYEMATTVQVDVPWPALLADLDTVLAAAYCTSVVTDLAEDRCADRVRVWLKARVDQGPPALDLGRPAETEVAMLPGADPGQMSPQRGRPGPWHERLPHFRAGFAPSIGAEIQSEYLLPRRHAVEALTRLHRLAPRLADTLRVVEVRTVAADEIWLSGAHGEDVIAVHATWILDPGQVAGAVDLLEDALLPLGARPHWGKVFHADADTLAAAYPRLADFRALRDRLDPDGVFDNPYLRRVLG